MNDSILCPICQQKADERVFVTSGTEGAVPGRVCYDSDELGRTMLYLHDRDES